MLFRSNFAAFRAVVRHEIQVPHPTLPIIKEVIPALRAEFGQLGDEYTFEAPNGAISTHAEIRGHFFDSVAAQEQNGWSDDDRLEVEKRLIKLSETWPEAVQVMSKPAAEKPWPSYDKLADDKVVAFAVEADLVEPALRYELENKKRSGVVSKLKKALEAAEAAAVEESEELAVA